uniref:Apple domain-containing protein n=1 Tax=Meloidogyne floridensis TaxID=298350 RepID=A0A915NKM7_9BILA
MLHISDFFVIYFGFLCHSKKAAEFVENVCSNNIEPSTTKGNISENYTKSTTISSITQTDSSTTKTFSNASEASRNLDRQQSPSPSPTPLSDACFVEQPGYVLEGMALAARQQVSPQLCKCLCAIAEWKQLLEGNESKHNVEGGCKSSQFYKNSGTCLISGENRVSAPERFSFDENSRQNGEQQSSYLDFRCGVD